jgi:stage III sporulation protein SpoIIIAA
MTTTSEINAGIMTVLAAKLEEAIEQAVGQYFRLVILAGAPASGKTTALRAANRVVGLLPYRVC